MNIYPAIDIKGGKCVRLIQGDFEQVTTYGDDPVAMARRWQSQGAQWLHIVDLDGARTGQSSEENVAAIQRIAHEVGLPLQVGGGIRTLEIAERMFGLGVTRVVVGTAAAQSAKLAQAFFERFGEQVAVGVDARDGMVAIHGWQEHSGEKAVEFVQRMAQAGAKRFIFTDIARDGMLQGVNLAALAQVALAVAGVPVIASGGVATSDDITALRALEKQSAPNIDGVIVGKALYAGTVALHDALTRASAD